ncbi:hypothetical protein MPS_0593 [Mycobacterium pseudoshottsii JCM 15466]|uniref:Uncharacterized protein n=1 Tax=Mycobacterium ulcerans str. Harvey TaxID=1299332 RepID=A0ABP3ALS8_MYCUL|nr:hypothetical protein MMSP_4952 [Mycobacterium sp. 012931]EPQ70278.1 hypothetical protein MMEU_4717 [Mycobacterium marinum str. Europe]EPQ73580.1 hypothetical protein MMMB2_4352 [Mycobacterium marinum MB2]EUA92120.1 hypothetical protein I551_1420 [Mycobacterium ulcerans str. Harvey]GAQ32214.1 hypothetical protein MPS_0593 [Mycobacterium pseudoshottsii JCM 15466]
MAGGTDSMAAPNARVAIASLPGMPTTQIAWDGVDDGEPAGE